MINKDGNCNNVQNLEGLSRIKLEKPKNPNKVLIEVIEDFIKNCENQEVYLIIISDVQPIK